MLLEFWAQNLKLCHDAIIRWWCHHSMPWCHHSMPRCYLLLLAVTCCYLLLLAVTCCYLLLLAVSYSSTRHVQSPHKWSIWWGITNVSGEGASQMFWMMGHHISCWCWGMWSELYVIFKIFFLHSLFDMPGLLVWSGGDDASVIEVKCQKSNESFLKENVYFLCACVQRLLVHSYGVNQCQWRTGKPREWLLGGFVTFVMSGLHTFVTFVMCGVSLPDRISWIELLTMLGTECIQNIAGVVEHTRKKTMILYFVCLDLVSAVDIPLVRQKQWWLASGSQLSLSDVLHNWVKSTEFVMDSRSENRETWMNERTNKRTYVRTNERMNEFDLGGNQIWVSDSILIMFCCQVFNDSINE